MKEYKLYNKLLDKISPKIELSVFDSFRKDRPISVSILQILIPFIQNNSSTYSSSLSLSYKSLSLTFTLGSKKLIKRMLMLTLILRCNHSVFNDFCNLLCRHYKKVLNWGDLSSDTL